MQASLSLIAFYQAQLDKLREQVAMIDAALSEHHRAKETLTNYKTLHKGDDLLIPVGADAYVRARVADPDTVLGGIGANVVLEDSPDEGIKRIAQAIAGLEEARERTKEDIQKVVGELNKLSELIERSRREAKNV